MRAFAVNDTLTVAGWAEDEEHKRVAIKWSEAGGMTKLGHLGLQTGFENLPGPWIAEAYSINFHGDVVGVAASANVFAAVLWRDGKVYDLNQLIPKGTEWVNLLRAYDINNKGCIVGIGEIKPYKTHAFLLVPVVLLSVSTTPVAVIGGQPITVQALLDGDAPFALEIEAKLIGLSGAAELTSPVATVREGARSADFTIETQPVVAEQSGELEASFGGTSLTTRLTVRP